jgi:serine/threonine protein kinase
MIPIPKTFGPHEFRGHLGSGGFSEVMLAFNRETYRYSACKIISRSRISTPDLLAKFDRELRVMVHLHHPAIVHLLALESDANFYYVFLDLCAEGDLHTYIAERKFLPETEAKNLFKQIIDALSYMHLNDIVHRDLKPENILIESIRQRRIKIADFGLSKRIPPNALAVTMAGSPCYAAPEILSATPYDPRKSDIWACGVVLYAMVTGVVPWVGPSLHEVYAQIKGGKYQTPGYLSDNCRDLIRRLLCVDPVERITLNEVLIHPWMRDAVLPPIYDMAGHAKAVTMSDIDVFFGIEPVETPCCMEQRSTPALPLLLPEFARIDEESEGKGQKSLVRQTSLRPKKMLQLPRGSIARIPKALGPRSGKGKRI